MRVRVPAPVKSYCISVDRLDGGLNLFEEESRLDINQTADMKNLIWRDGALASRKGQRTVCRPAGRGIAACERYFAGRAIFHMGSRLYAVDPANGDEKCIYSGLEQTAGTFFLYGGKLYYKTRGAYVVINEELEARPVEAYTPVILINADPKSGSGDLYQPENRLSARKTVWYNADGGKEYTLPVKGAQVVEITVDGNAVSGYGYDKTTGVVSLLSAPTLSDPPVNNTVRITYELDNPEARASIMDCTMAEVYGGESRLCIVMAGSTAQPDAYFWNGNHTAMDAGYFPMEHYNLVGDTISGFGRQQGMLVVFSEGSLGRAGFSLVEVDGRERISLPYIAINSAIGCDMPRSIQTVENNLVFCNSRHGVFRLQSTSAASENELQHISRNVDGTERRSGLLDAAKSGACASMNDGSRYWLAVGGKVFLWDYSISSPSKPSWFLFTNVDAAAFVRDGDDICYAARDGRVCAFYANFFDFGEAIEREYRLPPQAFGGYERLKDVDKVVLTLSSTTDSLLRLDYISDYGERTEPVPLRAYSWRLAPRNMNYRMMDAHGWSRSFVRMPACRHVRHFAMCMYNNEAGQDLTLLSARIFFRYRALER